MSTTIREATRADIPFLVWVVVASSRSHVPRGVWDFFVDDEHRLNEFIGSLLASEARHWCHWSGFLVAEVDGVPAAGLSGYSHEDSTLVDPAEAIRAGAKALGWTDDQIRAGFERIVPFIRCLPEDAPGAWIVEWVATRPEFRRQGLVDALLQREFEIGRERDHTLSQITVLVGNLPAQRAYERAGYRYEDERRAAVMEKVVGSAGLRRMLRTL